MFVFLCIFALTLIIFPLVNPILHVLRLHMLLNSFFLSMQLDSCIYKIKEVTSYCLVCVYLTLYFRGCPIKRRTEYIILGDSLFANVS